MEVVSSKRLTSEHAVACTGSCKDCGARLSSPDTTCHARSTIADAIVHVTRLPLTRSEREVVIRRLLDQLEHAVPAPLR